MSDVLAEVQNSRRRVASIWIVPIAAVLVGVWLAVDAYLSQGPTITVEFADANGIETDKTQVKALNVHVGTVTGIVLKEDLSGVVATLELTPEGFLMGSC